MRITALLLTVLLALGCGGDPESDGERGGTKDRGAGGPNPSAGTGVGRGPNAASGNSVTLTLSKIPKGFGIGSKTPAVIFERSGLLLRPSGHTWITFATTEDYKGKIKQIEDNTFLGGVANYVLPLLWKPGTYELTAGKSNYGDGENVFHFANGGTPDRMETVVKVPEGAKIVVEVHSASAKVTRLPSMKVATVEMEIHLTATHPVKAYHSDKMGAGWHPKAEVVDELEAVLEVKFSGKLSLPDQGQDWLK